MLDLKQLRKQIKMTDARIIKALALRQEISKQIGQFKLEHGKKIVDLEQEKKLFDFYKELSEQYKLQSTFIIRLFKLIIANSRRVQKS